MKTSYQFTVGAVALAAGVLSSNQTAQAQTAFNAGDLVVERVGGTSAYGAGAAALGSGATAVFVDEFSAATANQAGTVQTIALQASGTQPTPSSGSPNTVQLNLVDSGSATSDGYLSRSKDGTTLLLSGYNAILGTAVASSASSTNQRVIGTISAGGVVNTTTYSTTADTAGNFRSVTGTTGTGNFYTSGSGTTGSSATNLFPTFGGNTSMNIGTSTAATPPVAVTNTRVNGIFTVGGTQSLFYSTSSGVTGIYSYGGLPTASTGNTATLLVPDASPYGFSISADGKTIYVADDGSGKGILKYTSSTGAAGSFTLASTFVIANARGLVVDYSKGNPVLYATNGSTLFSITDDGVNTDFSGQSATTLATAPTNTAFRGLDFAPVPEPATWAAGALSFMTLTWVVMRRIAGLFGMRGA